MRLTNHNGGVQAPPFNDRIIIPALFMVTLWAWGPNVHYGHAYMMVLVSFVALALMAGDVLISALGVYVSIWTAYIVSASFSGLAFPEARIQAVDSLIFMTSGLLVYLAVRFGRTPPRAYMDGICVLSCILAVIGLVRVFFFDGNAVATLGNRNFLGAFLAIAAPCFYRRKWWMALPVIIVCLLMTQTSTAVAAFLVATGFYFLGWWGVGVSTVPALLYFLTFKTPESLFLRFGYWQDALSKLFGSWGTIFFGVGPGILWTPDNMLHSEYAYLIWNLGIVGLVLAGLYVWRSIRITSDRRITAAILAVLVDGFGNHLLHTAPTAFLAVAMFALNDRTLEAEP